MAVRPATQETLLCSPSGGFESGFTWPARWTVRRNSGSAEKIKMKMTVIDSIHENGAKLVEMSPESVSDLQAEQPGLRIVPVVYYYPAKAPRPMPSATPKAAAAALKISLTVVSKANRKPIAAAKVVAFTNFANRTGAQGTTNKKGIASLALGSASKKVERLYVYSASGFWNVLEENIMLKSGMKVEMLPIDLSFTDCLRHFYGSSAATAGQGVTVGVIDTGVGPHRDLTVTDGLDSA
jgi:subtilisin